jgi:hypothetical protein
VVARSGAKAVVHVPDVVVIQSFVLSYQLAARSGGSMRARWLACSLIIGVCGLWSSAGQAQSMLARSASFEAATNRDADARRTTMARALFDEGVRHLDAGHWSEAQDRFARVIDLRYSPVALYNLGLAQARCGHSVVAAATLRKLLADLSLEPKVREPASALLAEVEAQFAWITLSVSKSCETCAVYVDQELWPAAALNVVVPIDAGTHTLELRRGLTLVRTERVTVAAASRTQAVLGAPLDARAAALAATKVSAPLVATGRVPAADPHAAHGGSTLLHSPWLWGAMGVLAAGIATTIIIETR